MPTVPTLIWDSPRNPYLAVGIPLVLGTASGALVHGTTRGDFWYNSLRAPKANASKEAHSILWPLLYAVSGFGSFVIAQNLEAPPLSPSNIGGSVNPAARQTAIDALNLYWASLGLNLAWSPIFFGLKQPALALATNVGLTGVLAMLTAKAHSLPAVHGIPVSSFFAPYLLMVGYSTYLSGSTLFLNA